MSKKYPGGIIRGTPVVPAGPYQDGAAPGTWTLDQATNYIKQGIWPLAGNVNPNAFIENLFQTWLYTGNSSTQTITNGIDLSTYGGLVWFKCRTLASNNRLTDTVRGAGNSLISNSTLANQTSTGSGEVSSFTSTGYTTNLSGFNSTDTYASWTFRKQSKFFDVVTFVGNGGANQRVPHSLGSAPGCIITKNINTAPTDWIVYHRSLGTGGQDAFIRLNTTGAAVTGIPNLWGTSPPTATDFGVSNQAFSNGETYVAYLFAHNAGGFGLTGTDNVISCGSYTGTGAVLDVSLGYEPQWILLKDTSATGNWRIFDNMRGWPAPSGQSAYALFPNLSNAETDNGDLVYPTATGFQLSTNGTYNTSGRTYIYIAIRRGPMKTPTSGTSVYNATTWTGNNTTGRTLATGLSSPPDLAITQWRNGLQANLWWDMLRGFSTTAGNNSVYLRSQQTAAEFALADYFYRPDMVNVGFGSVASSGLQLNGSSSTLVGWFLRRAPGFFDEVCYTGDSTSPRSISHNLGVVPEMMIVKNRNDSGGGDWITYHSAIGNAGYIVLNATYAALYASAGWNNMWASTTPTSSVFTINTNFTNNSGITYVAYLFASCPGVSKVGSYTGTGATQTINCGFTGGARFVLIKRYDLAGQTTPGNVGDWYVWDTARGMVSGTDPSLLLNSTAAEVNANSVYTTSVGFQIVSTAAGINASGGSYLFWAVA